MSGEPDLLTPAPQEPAPVADAAPPVIEVVKPPEEDGEPDGIEAPDGEKYVKLSAVTTARAKAQALRAELETAKAEAGKSAEKDARIAELTQQLQQVTPYARAYQAAVEAQSRQPQKPAEPTPEQSAKLQEVARNLDFYNTDGSLNLSRAQAHLDLVREEARAIAQAQVQPYEEMTTAQQSGFMLQRALITTAPDGTQPDPAVLQEVWNRLDRRLTASAAGAAQAFSVALGHSALLGKLKGKAAPAAPVPEPLETERAGGKDVTPVALRDSDRKLARDMGLTDKQYAETLAEMPAGWGKGV